MLWREIKHTPSVHVASFRVVTCYCVSINQLKSPNNQTRAHIPAPPHGQQALCREAKLALGGLRMNRAMLMCIIREHRTYPGKPETRVCTWNTNPRLSHCTMASGINITHHQCTPHLYVSLRTIMYNTHRSKEGRHECLYIKSQPAPIALCGGFGEKGNTPSIHGRCIHKEHGNTHAEGTDLEGG